jgi:NADP-dependent 3-hydroxy acid dehydrogenase YdfG
LSSTTYWKNKRVVITGASSGLGHALVEYLAPMGVTFGLFSRRIEEMQSLARRFQNSGSRFFVRACDVRDRQSVDKCIKEFAREHGGLDVV